MRNRRFVQLPTSDDEENPPGPRNENEGRRKRRMLNLDDEEEDEREDLSSQRKIRNGGETKANEERKGEEVEEWDLRPLGKVIGVSGDGTERAKHYGSFEYNGVQYQLEDTVLLDPEHEDEKPYVAIIKEISKTHKEPLKITGQWLYRPDEAAKRGGGNYQPRFTRELFYSFHIDEVYAESVKHKCVVHFIPLSKQIPDRKKHPGFVVQKVYDFEDCRLYKITDKDYEDDKQREIDRLLKKTHEELGDLPDLEPNQMKTERLDKKRSVSPVDDSLVDKGLRRFNSVNLEASGRTPTTIGLEYYSVLSSLKLLTKARPRNKWLEKLLEAVQSTCTAMGSDENGKEERRGSDVGCYIPSYKILNGKKVQIKWPNKAVSAVAALEKAAHSAHSAEFGKYNQKMRQLVFNLKDNSVLTQRLLNMELEPAQILKMSPDELKKGLMAEEISSREPEELGHLQMTDGSCIRCSEKKVALVSIFQGGGVRQLYQLECQACGKQWQDMMMPD